MTSRAQGNGTAGSPEHPQRRVGLPYEAGRHACAALQRTYERVALFGGVYNNHLALRALLEDAEARGAEVVVCLGDLGGFGPHPERVVPLLRDAGVVTLAGNYDLSLAEGREDCGCGYSDPMDNHYAQISYAYTFAHTPAEHRAWMGTLPEQARLRVGRHTVHCCHGSPRRTNEFLWESATSDAALAAFLRTCDADVVAFTHTGIKWQRAVAVEGRRGRALNVGVIGRPENDGSTDVWYALLSAGPELGVELVSLAYDHGRLAAEMRDEGLPEEFAETVETGWWTTCLEILPAKERAAGRH